METQEPLFSIIIPVYNAEPWLKQCLSSVLCQNVQEIEVLCVDDASTDRSWELLQETQRQDKRLRLFQQSHKGQSAARNLALNNACGKYICFVDSDDFLCDNGLNKIASKFDESPADILLFDGLPFFETPEIEKKFKRDSVRLLQRTQTWNEITNGLELMNDMILADDYIAALWLGAFRRDFIQQNDLRFAEGIYYEDDLFWFQAFSAAKRCAYLSEKLYNYRIRANSTMTAEPDMPRLRSAYDLSLNMQHTFFQNRDRLKHSDGIAKMVLWLQNRARRMVWQMERNGTLAPENVFDELMIRELKRETPREKASRLCKRLLGKF